MKRLPPSGWMFAACAVWLAGLGAYFVFVRPPLLPEDPRYIGSTLDEIHAALPGLAAWLDRVFTVMGGFMAGAGVLTGYVALTAVRSRTPGAGWALALAGLVTVVLMSAINFIIASDFRWLLLVPALLWAAGIALYFLVESAKAVHAT
jgi:hypothetical protein